MPVSVDQRFKDAAAATEDQKVADHAWGRGMPWDGWWLAAFRGMVRVARLNPYVRTQMAGGRQRETALTRLAGRRPQLAGIVARCCGAAR